MTCDDYTGTVSLDNIYYPHSIFSPFRINSENKAMKCMSASPSKHVHIPCNDKAKVMVNVRD